MFIGFLLAIPYLTVLGAVGTEMGLRRWFVGRRVGDIREISKGEGFGGEKGFGKDQGREFEVGDMREGQVEGAMSIIGGPHASISKPMSGGRVYVE